MAMAFTVTGATVIGNKRMVSGTFTSSSGDSSGSLTATTHGLNNIVSHDIRFDSAGLNTPNPKVTVSAGTLTLSFDDSQGYSGTWHVIGS